MDFKREPGIVKEKVILPSFVFRAGIGVRGFVVLLKSLYVISCVHKFIDYCILLYANEGKREKPQ